MFIRYQLCILYYGPSLRLYHPAQLLHNTCIMALRQEQALSAHYL